MLLLLHPAGLARALQHDSRRKSGLCDAFEAAHGSTNVSAHLAGRDRWPVFMIDEGIRLKDSAYRRERDPWWPHDHSRFNALGPVLQCPPDALHTLGKGDGEKRVCMAAGGLVDLSQAPAAPSKPPCTVISVGSMGRYDFEEAVLERFPACAVHTLDCTLPESRRSVPTGLRGRVTLHLICLGARDEVVQIEGEGREFLTWRSIMKRLGLFSPPTVLKMDIEGFEWSVVRDLVRTPHLLPQSISLELHYQTQMRALPWYGRLRTPHEIGSWMDYLFTRGGYVLVDRNDNPYCNHCTEIVVASLRRCV